MNTKLNIIGLLFIVLGFSFLSSCKKSNRFAIETNPKEENFHIKRFDVDLIAVDTSDIKNAVAGLYKKYPEFMPVYISEILNENPKDTDRVSALFRNFLSDTTFTPVNKDVLARFQDISNIELSIADAYAHLQSYFPKMELPQVYFFVSGFNRSIILNDSLIGIGTDLYLGSDYPEYARLSYKYLTYNMRSECIPVDVVSAWLFKNFPVDVKEDRLLDDMLYRGKVMYLLSVLMPDQHPNDIIGYDKLQWEWCRKYEKDIWETILDRNDLFSTDIMLIRKYLNDAPFTSPVSQDSPGRLGTWVGWQIVRNYMDKNKDVTLVQLMVENDYQKILDKATYNPR
ncbi:MAG: hypothetical protein PHH37_13415 [Paludibacter sp.]|nr:hypothetical protein [Paludibacter sp.]